jgi:hypothetical protein
MMALQQHSRVQLIAQMQFFARQQIKWQQQRNCRRRQRYILTPRATMAATLLQRPAAAHKLIIFNGCFPAFESSGWDESCGMDG